MEGAWFWNLYIPCSFMMNSFFYYGHKSFRVYYSATDTIIVIISLLGK